MAPDQQEPQRQAEADPVVSQPDELPGLAARLGWRNPEDDGLSLRLYAADVPNPRWWRGNPAGRTIEIALGGHREGSEFRVLTEDELRAEIAAAETRGAAKALEETTRAWQWGAWADLSNTTNRIAIGQHVTDWLRARAAAAKGSEETSAGSGDGPCP